jgi:hypothetical protein
VYRVLTWENQRKHDCLSIWKKFNRCHAKVHPRVCHTQKKTWLFVYLTHRSHVVYSKLHMETFRVQCHGTVPYRAQFLETEFTPLNSKSTKAWEHGTKHAKLSQNLEFKFPWSGQPEKKYPQTFRLSPSSLRPDFSDSREMASRLFEFATGPNSIFPGSIHAVNFSRGRCLPDFADWGWSERGPPGFAANDIIESQKKRGKRVM